MVITTKQGHKAEVHVYQKSKGKREKGKNTNTGSKIGFQLLSKSQTNETNSSKDGLRIERDNLRRGCRLQDRGAVQGRSESRWRDIAIVAAGERRGSLGVGFANMMRSWVMK